MRNQTDSEVWNSYLLKSRFPKCSLVIDGDSLANNLYHSQINRGLALSHNPLNLYNITKGFISRLERYNLKIVRVYTVHRRNKGNTKEHKDRKGKRTEVVREWWENDLANNG